MYEFLNFISKQGGQRPHTFVLNQMLPYSHCRKNKCADQMHDYSAPDLHLCFHICKNRVSHDATHMLSGSIVELTL